MVVFQNFILDLDAKAGNPLWLAYRLGDRKQVTIQNARVRVLGRPRADSLSFIRFAWTSWTEYSAGEWTDDDFMVRVGYTGNNYSAILDTPHGRGSLEIQTKEHPEALIAGIIESLQAYQKGQPKPFSITMEPATPAGVVNVGGHEPDIRGITLRNGATGMWDHLYKLDPEQALPAPDGWTRMVVFGKAASRDKTLHVWEHGDNPCEGILQEYWMQRWPRDRDKPKKRGARGYAPYTITAAEPPTVLKNGVEVYNCKVEVESPERLRLLGRDD